MRRALFGEWGTGLDDDAFACAVAACGVLHARPRRARGASPGAAPGEASLADALRSAAGDETLVAWRFPSDRMLRAGGAFSGAAELADAWRAFRDSRPPLLRLALDPSTVAPTGVAAADLPALLQVLAHPAARVDAAFVAWRPGQRAAWKWPLRLGLLDDAKSAEVGVRVGALYPARDLSRAFRLCRDEGQCDVAVLPGSPRTSLARILASPVGERAGLVLFTGGCAGAAAQDHAVLQMIADEMRASGIAALSKPLPDPGLFVNDLINHLSHNMPLDVALFLAARDADAGPPILFLDPRFVERSQLASVARAMARKLERAGATPVAMTRGLSERIGVPPSAPVTARAAGKALRRSIPDFGFAGESHEATALARANPAVEAALAEANAGRRDPRYVQAQVERIAAGRSERVEQALVAGERACVKVRIGPDDAAWLNPVNRVPFPDELLPVDEDEHRLTVTLSEPHHLSEPLVASVTMGQTGASSVAHFELVPRPGQPPFRARITVTHRNRVLQTALLRARVLEPGEAPSADDRVTVEVEAVVRPLLHDLAGRRRFDVALAVNHTDQGQPTMLGLADDHAVLRGMTSIAAKLDAISKRLSVVAASSKRYAKGLEDDEGVDLLRFLANKGRDLYDFLIHDQADPVLGERLRNADYVQIVSLSPDAYFPAEFLYEFAVPADDAQVCPAALQALKNDDDSKICTAKDHEADPQPARLPVRLLGAAPGDRAPRMARRGERAGGRLRSASGAEHGATRARARQRDALRREQPRGRRAARRGPGALRRPPRRVQDPGRARRQVGGLDAAREDARAARADRAAARRGAARVRRHGVLPRGRRRHAEGRGHRAIARSAGRRCARTARDPAGLQHRHPAVGHRQLRGPVPARRCGDRRRHRGERAGLPRVSRGARDRRPDRRPGCRQRGSVRRPAARRAPARARSGRRDGDVRRWLRRRGLAGQDVRRPG